MRWLVLGLLVTAGCFTDLQGSQSGTATSGGEAPCAEGSPGCPCYPNETCNSVLECTGGVCLDPSCIDGVENCPCYANGTCNAGLTCTDTQVCKPPTSDTGGGSGTTDAMTSAGTTGGPGGDPNCHPSPPPEWEGPFVATSVVVNGGCPDPFGTHVADVFDGLSADPAICGCDCGAVTATECVAEVEIWGDPTCSGTILTSSPVSSSASCGIVAGVPSEADDALCAEVVSTSSPDAVCAPDPTTQLPEAAWGTHVQVCSAVPTSCDGGTLLPPIDPAFDLGVCIRAPGDLICPEGPYGSKHILFEDYDETRDCSTCTCEEAMGYACGGRIQFSSSADCDGDLASLPTSPLGAPHPFTFADIMFIDYEFNPADDLTGGSCLPQGGEAVGAATPARPVTLCCRG